MAATDQKSDCLVFRTDLQDEKAVARISEILDSLEGITEWCVDLEDWEKVLRVVGKGICSEYILETLRAEDVKIQEMEV